MISSLTNERIKDVIKLKDKKYRQQEQKMIVEGKHLIEEAKKANLLVEVFTTKEEIPGTLVSEDVMKKMASTDTTPSVLGVVRLPDKKDLAKKVLILDDVKDPTNMGTLLRSAKSFGFDTVCSSPESVDYFNDKVVRGSQGAIFKLNLLRKDLLSFIDELKEKGYLIYGTNVRGGIDVKEAKKPDKMALILGNETLGVRETVEAKADKNLYIKLDDMESLNVSVAGSILMYELKK